MNEKTKTAKLFISRDLRGDNRHSVYFWNKKPRWDSIQHHFECSDPKCDCEDECTEVATVSVDCDDLNPILELLGIEDGTLERGELVEIAAKVTSSKGITLAQEAKELAKKIRSKKKVSQTEVLAFLKGIENDYEDDLDQDEQDKVRM